ncbi:hypothetical protein CXG81DRAFT_27770 [Caulochytrium protostelioides]|uniref:Uncharacterized protein n=1 Tax=Caulochytrium protostelioides TaxID=1555241 RepID=A0A4P9WVW3_9FUNG|nr:hypothetical protein CAUPRSCDRAFT_10823 [Caulochytrium protostelioides]RKO99476.1 hypothetical protein CXG81DRAFT_27770 [Caulochytrium protostelioides]|eukprot:RKO99476.1 hypothetical protein CXG81DRAFT_27770 [Caulochytrium protostelioides]
MDAFANPFLGFGGSARAFSGAFPSLPPLGGPSVAPTGGAPRAGGAGPLAATAAAARAAETAYVAQLQAILAAAATRDVAPAPAPPFDAVPARRPHCQGRVVAAPVISVPASFGVRAAALDAAGRLLLARRDGTLTVGVRAMPTAAGASTWRHVRTHPAALTAVCALADGRVVLGHADGTLRLLHGERLVDLASMADATASGAAAITQLAVAPHHADAGSRLAVADAAGGVTLVQPDVAPTAVGAALQRRTLVPIPPPRSPSVWVPVSLCPLHWSWCDDAAPVAADAEAADAADAADADDATSPPPGEALPRETWHVLLTVSADTDAPKDGEGRRPTALRLWSGTACVAQQTVPGTVLTAVGGQAVSRRRQGAPRPWTPADAFEGSWREDAARPVPQVLLGCDDGQVLLWTHPRAAPRRLCQLPAAVRQLLTVPVAAALAGDGGVNGAPSSARPAARPWPMADLCVVRSEAPRITVLYDGRCVADVPLRSVPTTMALASSGRVVLGVEGSDPSAPSPSSSRPTLTVHLDVVVTYMSGAADRVPLRVVLESLRAGPSPKRASTTPVSAL